jgi:hypothetical protein
LYLCPPACQRSGPVFNKNSPSLSDLASPA